MMAGVGAGVGLLVHGTGVMTTAPTPAIIEPDRDSPVLQSRYHLRPRPRPSPYNLWQGGT